jgi:hypothetical protein
LYLGLHLVTLLENLKTSQCKNRIHFSHGIGPPGKAVDSRNKKWKNQLAWAYLTYRIALQSALHWPENRAVWLRPLTTAVGTGRHLRYNLSRQLKITWCCHYLHFLLMVINNAGKWAVMRDFADSTYGPLRPMAPLIESMHWQTAPFFGYNYPCEILDEVSAQLCSSLHGLSSSRSESVRSSVAGAD